MSDNTPRVHKLTCGDHVIRDTWYSTLFISKGSVVAITEVLVCFKFGSLWLPHMLTDARQCSFARVRYKGWSHPLGNVHVKWKLGLSFLTPIQLIIHGHDTPKKEEIRTWAVSRENQATIFWNGKSIIVKFLSTRETVKHDLYTETLWSMNTRLRQVCSTSKMSKILLLHGSARPLSCAPLRPCK